MYMEEVGMSILKWAVTAIVAGIVSAITARIKVRKQARIEENKVLQERFEKIDDRDELFASALRSMLRQDIINAYEKYTNKGCAKVYIKDNVLEMYKNYHELGGNGTVTKLIDEFMELPTDNSD